MSATATTVSTRVDLSIHTCCAPKPAPTTQRTADGKVRFENENYRITCGDDNEVRIFNKATGESYRIWGDPHVQVDGRQAFDFWGQTTFVLEDGTKVTIVTTPWEGGHNGATVTSQVVITDGDYTAHITGVDTNTRGDLGFAEYATGGALVDLAVADGNTIFENRNGAGFVGVDARGRLVQVDQCFINATDERFTGAHDRTQEFLGFFARMLGDFGALLSVSFSGSIRIRIDVEANESRGRNHTRVDIRIRIDDDRPEGPNMHHGLPVRENPRFWTLPLALTLGRQD